MLAEVDSPKCRIALQLIRECLEQGIAMYIALALHHPKGSGEKKILMDQMPRLAEVYAKHKGFVQMMVGEVEDENIIVPFSIWESEEAYKASMPDVVRLLSTIDFSVQDGPTRAGASTIAKGAIITPFKVRPVRLR